MQAFPARCLSHDHQHMHCLCTEAVRQNLSTQAVYKHKHTLGVSRCWQGCDTFSAVLSSESRLDDKVLAAPQSLTSHCAVIAESEGGWWNILVWRQLLCHGQVPGTRHSQGLEELHRQLEGISISDLAIPCLLSSTWAPGLCFKSIEWPQGSASATLAQPQGSASALLVAPP